VRIEITAIILYILLLQEVLDLDPRVVMLMLHHDHMVAIILAESGNHHVTTHTLHKIMTVVMGQHQALTIRRGVGKIALIGRNLNGFAFQGFYNVYCEINRCTVM
jgi:hypothetical protein